MFLNKCDLLEAKMKAGLKLRKFIPQYNGDDTLPDAIKCKSFRICHEPYLILLHSLPRSLHGYMAEEFSSAEATYEAFPSPSFARNQHDRLQNFEDRDSKRWV